MTTVADIITAVGYRVFTDDSQTITSTSFPKEAECIQWINEDIAWILGVCAEMGSELGRTTGSITTADGVASSSTLAADMYSPADYGWVLKTNSRNRITLTTEEASLDYNPSTESEPSEFYIDGSNNVIFLPTPDAIYTVKIPYWKIQTALTATTDTIPFLGLFDNLIIETVALRVQNREEYDLNIELKWMQYLLGKARNVIQLRKNPNIKVTL